MARSRKLTSPTPSSPEDIPPVPLSVVIPPEERETVRVNNANATELKIACDDAVKRYLSRPTLFTQIHTHTDVRLALGWASVFVAGATALYGYKVEFEKSKPVVWVGLIVYMALTALQTLYAYFIERDIIYVAKRKTFSKRIITERMTISSSTRPPPAGSGSHCPEYELSLTYLRTTNGGKSLLAKGKTRAAKGYNAFFDDKGTMNQPVFERWVGELVEKGMEGGS